MDAVALYSADSPQRLKRFNRSQLSHVTMKRIAEAVLATRCSHADAAARFCVKVPLVRRLLKQYRADPGCFDEPAPKKQLREVKAKAVIDEVNQFRADGRHIWRSSQLVQLVNSKAEATVTEAFVSRVLRRCCGYRYKRVKRHAWQGNSEQNIVKRAMYAKVMLDLLAQKKRIINADESWINQQDFRHHKWCRRHDNNSAPQKEIDPRISLLVAIDSWGEVYVSLTQVNTNSEVFSIFLERLASKLTEQRPDWRQDTVLLLDGARYHNSEVARATIARLRIPICFSAPYSYETAPVELYFGIFKRTNLFTDNSPTGKK